MTVLDRIRKIGERWFLTEPLLFAVYCSHEFCENDLLEVAMRTGNRKVEFAPKILENVPDAMLTEFLKVEMFRILLKHPYQRQPPFAEKSLLTRASNITIADVYEVPQPVKRQMSGTELKMPKGLCFEEYYNLLKQVAMPSGGAGDKSDGMPIDGSNAAGESTQNSEGGKDSSGKGGAGQAQEKRDAQISELWDEDEEACCDINGFTCKVLSRRV